jgi:ammonia channel protein AmtB
VKSRLTTWLRIQDEMGDAIVGLRVAEEEETVGLDFSQPGEKA